MSSSASTIEADVPVTLNDNVARELLSRAGVTEGDIPSWRLPDGTQTTDPQAALAGALRGIAAGHGVSRADADELPAVGSTITLTLPAPLALGLVEYAGMEPSDDGHGWRTRDGRESPDPTVAVTDALVAIAEDDLAAEFTERDALEPCSECGVYTSDADHACVVYDGPECETPGCHEQTIFVSVAAPGTGQGRRCKTGHYHGTCRELTIADAI